MVDNFKFMDSLIFPNEEKNMYFHCRIVKIDESTQRESSLITSYYINSKEQLNELKEEIITICIHCKAKAFIGVSGKEYEDLQKQTHLLNLRNNLNNKIGNDPLRCLDELSINIKSKSPKWIVNINDIHSNESKLILDWINNYFWEKTCKVKKVDLNYKTSFGVEIIPKINGVYCITDPFDIQKFKEKFPSSNITEDGYVLLYSPDNLDSNPAKYCCSNCGGTNIQILCWIDPNTGRYCGESGDNDCWCDDCQNTTKLKVINNEN